MGGHVIRIPMDKNGLGLAYIMGGPRKRSSHSQSKEEPSRSWGAPDLTVNIERENTIDTHIRNFVGTDHPSMEASPYILVGNHTPPSTPSGRCKSPFIPSFKYVTKMLTFPSFLCGKYTCYLYVLTFFPPIIIFYCV